MPDSYVIESEDAVSVTLHAPLCVVNSRLQPPFCNGVPHQYQLPVRRCHLALVLAHQAALWLPSSRNCCFDISGELIKLLLLSHVMYWVYVYMYTYIRQFDLSEGIC